MPDKEESKCRSSVAAVRLACIRNRKRPVAGRRVVRRRSQEESGKGCRRRRKQGPKTLQAVAEGLGFIRNGTGRFSLKKRHGLIYISERSFCPHCKGFGLKQGKDEYRDSTAVF